jgi:putative ABC transport system permease protein
MKPRWRKVIADLWGNKARFILVVLSLTVGLFSVGMIAGGYVTILEDMQTGYEAIHPADLRFVLDPFDEELIERVKRVDGVTTADAEVRLRWQFQNGEGEWENLSVRVIPDDGQTLDQVELQSGALPASMRSPLTSIRMLIWISVIPFSCSFLPAHSGNSPSPGSSATRPSAP